MTAPVTTGRPITVEDLFRLKIVGDPQPAPDGSRIAYVVTTFDPDADAYRSQIWVIPAAGGTPLRYTSGKRDTSPRWSPDGRRLAFISRRDDVGKADNNSAQAEIWIIDTNGGEAWPLTQTLHGAADPVWSPDGQHIAYTARIGGEEDERARAKQAGKDQKTVKAGDKPTDVKVITGIRYKANGIAQWLVGRGRRHIFVVGVPAQLATPQAGRQLTAGDWDDASPAWSPDGTQIAFSSNRHDDRELVFRSDIWVQSVVVGAPRQLTAGQGPSGQPAWSPDGTQIAYIGHTSPEPYGRYQNAGVWVVPSAGGAAPQQLAPEFDRSFAGSINSDVRLGVGAQSPFWSPDGQSVYATAIDRGAEHLYRLTLAGGAPTLIIGGDRGVMNVWPLGGKRLVFTAGTVTEPGNIFTCALDGSDEQQLTQVNDALFKEVAIGAAQQFTYTGAAGWEIDGWLIEPVNRQAGQQYPLVLEIHGGPATQYGYGFYHEFQLLAAQGYAVLYTNPRGSTGRETTFTIANRSRWGEEDYQDIMAGVDAALAAHPWLDDKRLGVLGGSFGGFMTNWIVGHTDRFKAAVTMRCVSNLFSFYGTSDIGFTFLDMQFETDPLRDLAKLLYYSPITYAKEMHTPLLIIHAEQDYRCPIEQSEQLYITLKMLGRTTEFVRVPDEDHELSRSGKPQHRAERLRQILRWFKTYL